MTPVLSRYVLSMALAIKLLLIAVAFVLPVNLLVSVGQNPANHSLLISYAPEVWLSLLALVFGTLIIVVSIASENTPKLIDLFIGDPRGRFYIWLVMLSSLENIYLQIFVGTDSKFYANLIVINNYLLLPALVLLAIPYIFYTLRNTRSDNVVDLIFAENLRALRLPKGATTEELASRQFHLFETINQLHDLAHYIQFKEPKASIIHKMGISLRHYLEGKRYFPESFFKLDDRLRRDISFRTLVERLTRIEKDKTFYEEKVLRVLGSTYLHLMRDGHYELASLCGNELFETGKTAIHFGDEKAVDIVIIHFNTFIRYGLNQGLRTREIRYVHNSIFHYAQFVNWCIVRRHEDRVRECCENFCFYATEVARMSASEPLFVFLTEAISFELKKMLVLMHTLRYPKGFQKNILGLFSKLYLSETKKAPRLRQSSLGGIRLIRIALCLYYLDVGEEEFSEWLIDSILSDLTHLSSKGAKEAITSDCESIDGQPEDFWEETDQGFSNMFYTPHKNQLAAFRDGILDKLRKSTDDKRADSLLTGP